jgi:hypothetical protein
MIAITALRKLLFYLFLLIYLLVCPVVILHVLGYDIRPGGKREIVSTGDLYVASFPPGARLFIDDEEYPRQTPTSVLDLKPGKHELRLWAEGYLPWTQAVVVEAGKAAVLDDVLLLPEHWPRVELHTGAFEEILPSSEYPNLLLRRGAMLEDLYVYQIRRQTFLSLGPPGGIPAGNRVLNLVPLAGGRALLIEARTGSKKRWFVMTIQPGRVDVQDLTDLLPDSPAGLQWCAETPEDLFFYREGSVTRIHVPTATLYPSFPYRVRGFGVGNGTLCFLTAAGDLLIQGYDSERAPVPAGFSGIGAPLPQAGFLRLTPLRDGTVILQAPDGELFATGKDGPLALGKVKGFRVATDPLRLLLWQDQRLGILWLGGVKQPEHSEGARLEWIPLQAIEVEQAFFVLEGTHLLYRDRGKVFLVAPERDGQRKTFPVVEVRDGTSVYYSDRDGKLYYIDKPSGRLSSLEIIGKNEIVDQLLLDIRKRIQP